VEEVQPPFADDGPVARAAAHVLVRTTDAAEGGGGMRPLPTQVQQLPQEMAALALGAVGIDDLLAQVQQQQAHDAER
jgi:hypothetical protein